MARVTKAGLELKCRRWKAVGLVPVRGRTREWIEGCRRWAGGRPSQRRAVHPPRARQRAPDERASGLFPFHEGGSMDRGRLCFALTMATLVTGNGPALAETLEQRVERMEKELREVKSELRRRDAADRRRAAEESKRKAAETAAAPPSAKPGAVDAAPAPAPAPEAGAEPARTAKAGDNERGGYLPSSLRAITDRVKLGGYGSIRFEANSNPADNNTFTYRRFVLTTDANIAPRLRAYMELELERFRVLEVEKTLQPSAGGLAAEQSIEATNGSEISLEQAWLQYDVQDWLKFRGGAVLVPVGRFNLHHDDDLWDLPRRSLVDRGVPVL